MRVRSTTESAVRAASSDSSRSVRLSFYSSSLVKLGWGETPGNHVTADARLLILLTGMKVTAFLHTERHRKHPHPPRLSFLPLLFGWCRFSASYIWFSSFGFDVVRTSLLTKYKYVITDTVSTISCHGDWLLARPGNVVNVVTVSTVMNTHVLSVAAWEAGQSFFKTRRRLCKRCHVTVHRSVFVILRLTGWIRINSCILYHSGYDEEYDVILSGRVAGVTWSVK